jgi:hypothetical protein
MSALILGKRLSISNPVLQQRAPDKTSNLECTGSEVRVGQQVQCWAHIRRASASLAISLDAIKIYSWTGEISVEGNKSSQPVSSVLFTYTARSFAPQAKISIHVMGTEMASVRLKHVVDSNDYLSEAKRMLHLRRVGDAQEALARGLRQKHNDEALALQARLQVVSGHWADAKASIVTLARLQSNRLEFALQPLPLA